MISSSTSGKELNEENFEEVMNAVEKILEVEEIREKVEY